MKLRTTRAVIRYTELRREHEQVRLIGLLDKDYLATLKQDLVDAREELAKATAEEIGDGAVQALAMVVMKGGQ
jgi:hypothetical protein